MWPAWLEGNRVTLTQFFLRAFDEEPALLAALEPLLARASAVVPFNGAGFDLPLLETRFVLARRRWPGLGKILRGQPAHRRYEGVGAIRQPQCKAIGAVLVPPGPRVYHGRGNQRHGGAAQNWFGRAERLVQFIEDKAKDGGNEAKNSTKKRKSANKKSAHRVRHATSPVRKTRRPKQRGASAKSHAVGSASKPRK